VVRAWLGRSEASEPLGGRSETIARPMHRDYSVARQRGFLRTRDPLGGSWDAPHLQGEPAMRSELRTMILGAASGFLAAILVGTLQADPEVPRQEDGVTTAEPARAVVSSEPLLAGRSVAEEAALDQGELAAFRASLLAEVEALIAKRLARQEAQRTEERRARLAGALAEAQESAKRPSRARDRVSMNQVARELNLTRSEEDQVRAMFHDHVEKLVDLIAGDEHGARDKLLGDLERAKNSAVDGLSLKLKLLAGPGTHREQLRVFDQSGRRLLGDKRWERLTREFIVEELDHVGILRIVD